MSEQSGAGVTVVGHRAFERPACSTDLTRARLTDKERYALLFQGAAVLAHLRVVGSTIGSWNEARVGDDGVLHLDAAVITRSEELPQLVLLRFLRVVFSEPAGIVGRGEARRAARSSKARWQQKLAPINLDLAVTELLEEGPFLWSRQFRAARTALVSERPEGDGVRPWLVGPGGARRRFLLGATTRAEIEGLLRSEDSRDLWEGFSPRMDAMTLARGRRWRLASLAWRRNPPTRTDEVLEYSRCLVALGKYTQALRVLRGQSGVAARTLRCSCQLGLGQLNPASHTLRQLEQAGPSAKETLDVAEIAIRVWALRGRLDRVREWIANVLHVGRGQLRGPALAVAAGGAWDVDELDRMDELLTELKELSLTDSALRGSYHKLRALQAIAIGDGLSVVDHLTKLFRRDRRRLVPTEAGRIWNDLAVGRALSGDLPGAEKACNHAVRLLSEAEGPSPTTLALYNLAEVRLRRGRTAGVEQILTRSTAENRRSGNVPGLVRDFELWVRVELVAGQPLAALGRCSEALHEIEEQGVDHRSQVFWVFMARANGWLGRRQAAAELLELVGPEAIAELEVEERPALWALAGSLESAAKEAAGTPWAELWSSYVSDRNPGARAWIPLETLEPFRAARLVLDCELTRAGSVPEMWIRKALLYFRESGSAFAEKLESARSSSWQALASYLRKKERGTVGEISHLFAAAGYGEARLIWSGEQGCRTVLVDGAGGSESIDAEVPNGSLTLFCDRVDEPLESFVSVIAGDLAALPVEREHPRPDRQRETGMIGRSPALLEAIARLDKLAAGELPILILGETGTGKELFARRAHASSARRSNTFMALNCAALPESLIQSELFGHVRGAFTGADRDRAGVFESASGGTVFLDEIGDLPLFAQGQLLRALQEKEIRRVGESFVRRIDVRIVAATHRDLERMVTDGEFRQDLYFRLKVARIALPPLRARGDDIVLLADHFLEHSAMRLSPAARALLSTHSWPGNVRELRNVVAVASALAGPESIDVEHLDIEVDDARATGSYHREIQELRCKLVDDALRSSGGNRARAARLLGISRQALSYLIRQLGLFVPRPDGAGGR